MANRKKQVSFDTKVELAWSWVLDNRTAILAGILGVLVGAVVF